MPAPPAKAEISGAYPVPSAGAARIGFSKLWETLFGTSGLLGATGTPADARAALGVGPVISNRNRVRNGGFVINQRVLSGTVTLAAGVYGHDGWKAGAAGCTYTFAASGNDFLLTITAGSLVQIIEAGNVEGGTYVMSWSGTATGKINGGSLAASGVTATSVIANANLTIEFSTGTLTKVQVEPGSTVTPYERRTLSSEMALNRDYYQVIGRAFGTVLGSGVMLLATEPFVFGALLQPMRAAPTAAINYAGVGFSQLTNGTSSATASGGATLVASVGSYALDIPSSATQVANAGVVIRTVNASQYLSFSAEL